MQSFFFKPTMWCDCETLGLMLLNPSAKSHFIPSQYANLSLIFQMEKISLYSDSNNLQARGTTKYPQMTICCLPTQILHKSLHFIFSLPMAQQSFSWARSTSLEHKISWKKIKSGWPVLQKSILSCYCICSSVTREKTDFMCRTVWFVAWAFESSLSEYVLPPV